MAEQIQASLLKAKLKDHGWAGDDAYRTRIHRAISWIGRSEAEPNDPDARFIFLWIAFNAAYAREFSEEQSERALLRGFFETIVAMDRQRRLHKILFERFPGPIRTLLDNKYVFAPFWRALREHDSSDQWERSFTSSKRCAMSAVLGGDTITTLCVVFDRLYVLRNQLVHGGATWNSSVNRDQVRDGTAMLSELVPWLVHVMLDAPDTNFGSVAFPVLGAMRSAADC